MNLKQLIVDKIKYDSVDKETLYSLLEIPKIETMGDYSLACFTLAKTLHKSPLQIAQDIEKTIEDCKEIEKTEVINGYLNIYLNKSAVYGDIIDEIEKNDIVLNIGNGKTVCIDYCSPNLAKYLHIGHWATTIIGESLARIYQSLGYKVIRINYIGDFGTPFGKMVCAYNRWGNKEDIDNSGVDAIQNLYVKFCANESEELMEDARRISLEIENKSGKDYETYCWFIEVAKKECNRLVEKIGISFDDWRGESTYNDLMQPVVDELKQAGLTKVSDGALICDLSEYGLGVAVIQRSDGASLYITRDITAVEDRHRLYNFYEMIYVTAIQQNLHFAQLFKICELLSKPYAGKLFHASYGMFSLPNGKIASRKGKQALFEDILTLSENRVREVLKDRPISSEKKEELVRKISKSAAAFSVLKVDRNKDIVFDIDKATSFEGETGPYIQYTVARINSVLKKISATEIEKDGEFSVTQTEFSIAKELNLFENVVMLAYEKKEPSLISRELLQICALFNKLYSEEKFVDTQNKTKTKELEKLCQSVKKVLTFGMQLICVDYVEEM